MANGVFKSASFGKAILLGSQMQGADLSNANLSNAQGLSQAQLDTACGDVDTLLPDGLFLPFCIEQQVTPAQVTPVDTSAQNKLSKDRTLNDPLIFGFDQK